MANKIYCVDTNVLLDDPDCIPTLRNGEENQIFIPMRVLMEMDNLKEDPRLKNIISKAIDSIIKYYDFITFIDFHGEIVKNSDIKIMEDLELYFDSKVDSEGSKLKYTIVSNDKIFRLISKIRGHASDIQEYESSKSFESESQLFTGICDEKELVLNCFYKDKEGKYKFHGKEGDREIWNHKSWGIEPRDIYQKMAIDLIMNEDLDLISLQSEAGKGKSLISMACAFELVFKNTEKSKTNPKPNLYDKIYVIKPNIEIGKTLGFLPGSIDEKMEPYFKYLEPIIKKLNSSRQVKRLFKSENGSPGRGYNEEVFETMPVSFLRGMTIENAVVILDEAQNISRYELRSILTRMGKNCKVIVNGDVRQIDNPHLNILNNGLHWLVSCCKGKQNYAHMVLAGDKSRGPICDLIIDSGL